MRKVVLGVGVCFLVISLQVRAERWILKNPQRTTVSDVVSQIHFGVNRYVVIEDQHDYLAQSEVQMRSESLKQLTQADWVIVDPKIGLIQGVPSSAEPPAWHVQRLKYDQIPKGIDGTGVVVAVLDTGLDVRHEALRDHLWLNSREIPDNGKDDDGNGFVDDINGYNFSESDSDIVDNQAHGTHCGGVVAAGSQAKGSARGVAPGSRLMGVKIIGDRSNDGFLSHATDGIKYAVDNGAKILSNSWRIYKNWSGYYDEKGIEMMAEAIRYADSKGAIFVAAAGNESTDLNNQEKNPMFPAGMPGHPNLFVVAATAPADAIAGFSNYGNRVVQVAAPGVDIVSTIPGGRWQAMSGTSMATPMVAGILALGIQRGYSPVVAMEKLVRLSEKKDSFAPLVISGGIVDIIGFLQ